VSFWTTQRIRNVLASENSPIVSPNLGRVTNACYEMSLGSESYVTSEGGTKRVSVSGEQIRIPPGQFALLLTEEKLCLPLDILGFISIKASKKFNGLVNVSGFHVDPGFEGNLKFSVYNAGAEAIVLQVGEPLFPIWFYQLPESNVDAYNGKHKGQSGISSDDVTRLQGDVASPQSLKKEIDELRETVAIWKAATLGVLATSIPAAIAAVLALIIKVMK